MVQSSHGKSQLGNRKDRAMKPLEKGTYAYFTQKRTRQTIWTIILLAVPLALFIAGFVMTGTQKNLLTFVAILGMLPACKSAVEMIMYFLYHGCDAKLYEQLSGELGDLCHAYGLVFTTPDSGTFEVPSIVVRNQSICGYGRFSKQSDKHSSAKLEAHIAGIMRQNGYSKVVVKIFDKEDAYLTRVRQLKQLESENEATDLAQKKLLCDISL